MPPALAPTLPFLLTPALVPPHPTSPPAAGTYYATAEKLKFENAMNIKAFLDVGAGEVVVAAVVEVSEEGRAAKQVGPTVACMPLVFTANARQRALCA